MRPGFHDAALIEHDNDVGVENGRKPVRDADGRAAFHQLIQRGLHCAFGFGVQRAGSLVEDQDGRIFQNGAGNGQALALAAGKHDALFADDGVETLAVFA